MSGNPSPPLLQALTFQFSSKINTASSAQPWTDASQVQPRKGVHLGCSFDTHMHRHTCRTRYWSTGTARLCPAAGLRRGQLTSARRDSSYRLIQVLLTRLSLDLGLVGEFTPHYWVMRPAVAVVLRTYCLCHRSEDRGWLNQGVLNVMMPRMMIAFRGAS